MNLNFLKKRPYFPLLILLLITFVIAACGGSEPAASDEMGDMEEMDDEHEHDDMEAMSSNRIPNEGATVQITSPSSGDSFAASQQIIVEIETENFDLTEEGYHWHVYVDGESWGMVLGGNYDQPLTGLEPGEHMIEVFLSIPSHEEMEDGDSVMITVTE